MTFNRKAAATLFAGALMLTGFAWTAQAQHVPQAVKHNMATTGNPYGYTAPTAPPAPPPPQYDVEKRWGALVYDTQGKKWHLSFDLPNEKSARKSAMAQCQDEGGTCQSMLTYSNQCVSIARMQDANGMAIKGNDSVNTGTTEEEAVSNAMASCRADWGVKSCVTVTSQCVQHSIVRTQ